MRRNRLLEDELKKFIFLQGRGAAGYEQNKATRKNKQTDKKSDKKTVNVSKQP